AAAAGQDVAQRGEPHEVIVAVRVRGDDDPGVGAVLVEHPAVRPHPTGPESDPPVWTPVWTWARKTLPSMVTPGGSITIVCPPALMVTRPSLTSTLAVPAASRISAPAG